MGSLREHCFPCERANGLYGCVGYGANLFRFFYVLRTFFLAALLGAFFGAFFGALFGAFLAPFFRLNKRRTMPITRVLRAFPVLTWFLEVRLDCLNDLRGFLIRYHTRGRLRTRVNVEISMFVLCTFYSRVCPEFGGL